MVARARARLIGLAEREEKREFPPYRRDLVRASGILEYAPRLIDKAPFSKDRIAKSRDNLRVILMGGDGEFSAHSIEGFL